MSLPELPDGTRIEFEHWCDVEAAWRNDRSSERAGWPTGDGGKVWCVYGETVPITWAEMIDRFGEDSLRLAVRLLVHPDDAGKHEQWPTSVYAQKPIPSPRLGYGARPRRSRPFRALGDAS